MESRVSLLNFDGIYRQQDFYQHKHYNWIDLQSIPGTNLLCEKETLQLLSKKMNYISPNSITYIGSGNYHYASYLLQTKIKTPYTLILFDHHTDTLPSPSNNMISCGSWVLDSLNSLTMLEKVYIIGVGEDAPNHIPESILNRVVYYTKSILQTNFKEIIKSMLKNINTDSVYISIDKDVLDQQDAVTGWDHGTMRMNQLLTILKQIFVKKYVIGADICGEKPMDDTNRNINNIQEANKKNNFVNLLLLNYMSRWMKEEEQSVI